MNGRFLKAARCLVGVTLIALGASTASAAVNRHHPGSSKRTQVRSYHRVPTYYRSIPTSPAIGAHVDPSHQPNCVCRPSPQVPVSSRQRGFLFFRY